MRFMNILLIDDNRHDVFLLREALSEVKSDSLQLHHADRLSAGLSRLAGGDMDALLLDLDLPDSSGLDTLERVRERHPEVPIVILTGMDDERLAILGVQKGAQDYLVKGPYDGAMIYRSVRYAIERKRFLTELQERVQEQTAELTAANQALRHEIIERKVVERALRESERRFRTLYDETPSIYFTVDAAGIVRSVNQYGAQYLGYAVEDLVGKPVAHICVEEDRRLVQDRMQAFLDHPGQVDEWEFRKVRADGAVLWVHEIVRIIQDADGEPLALIVCEDITARKAAETEKALLEERLRQAEKMESIGALAGGIAHDFNNLLTVITGYAQIGLAQTAAIDAAYKKFQEIAGAAQRATGLTKQLLAFSRKQVLQSMRLVLNDVIADTETLLKRVIGEHIVLHMTYSPEPIAILADRTQLEQVLINLAVNARDAMPTGGRLQIQISRTAISAGDPGARGIIPPGRYAIVEVADTGCGMDAATKARAFEPFFTTKKPGEGTGLGLATVYGIVKQTGGYIFVESEPGQGTGFTLYFPEVEAPASRSAAVGSASATPANPAFKPNNITILFIEDDVSVRRLVHQLLESHGYQILSAADGEAGLKAAESHPKPIDVLVTDVVMPRLNGAETAKRLLEKHPRLKVLYTSGYADNTILHHGLVQSEVAFLPKPFQPNALLKRLSEILSR